MPKYAFIAIFAVPLSFTLAAQDEVQTTISFDGKTKIESLPSTRQGIVIVDKDLFISYLHDSQWSSPVPLPACINSMEDELYPSLSSDEQDLYFVRVRKANPKDRKDADKTFLMVSHKENGIWQEPQTLVFSQGIETAPRILPDNRTLLFSALTKDEGERKLHYADFYSRKVSKFDWLKPMKISSSNTEINTAPVMTIEGSVSDQSGAPMDASICVLDALTRHILAPLNSHDGEYRIALPKGRHYILDITAKGYSHDYREYDLRDLNQNKTIHYDVQLHKQLAIRVYTFDGELQTPIRVDDTKVTGAQVVTQDEYVDLTLPIGREYKAIFTKKGYTPVTLDFDTRKQVLLTEAELDIELQPATTPLRLFVVDASTGSLISSEVRSLWTTDREDMTITGTGARESLIMRQGLTYNLHLDAVGYMYYDSLIAIPYNDQTLTLQVPLQSLQETLIMQLKNIRFAYNSATLMPSSFVELDKVVKLLETNPKLHIEIAAHTDDRGSDKYNLRLSQKRGEAARMYIISKGIAPERLVAHGYGKQMPLVPNTSDENRAINRRVEFKVIGL